jgi:hypothetical protein
MKSPKAMRFTVMRIHSEHRIKWALKLLGWCGTHWIVPRTVAVGFDEKRLLVRAADLNSDLAMRGKLLSCN